MNAHSRTAAGRATLAVAGAGALLALGGGLAHADTPDGPEVPETPETPETPATTDDAGPGVPVFLLDGAPALPAPDALLTPVDLTAPAFAVLDGLT
ncbi:hypothetical protein GCM10009613_33610 [Pseudonocardia kongjuensis]|uniref:Uncharacterized protein n=1 Tax=Pseudonocardia kongjuensis TaxID=102227 RepID=A0ABN1XW52_9PSEU